MDDVQPHSNKMACKERIHKLVDVQIAQKQMIMET